MRKRDEADILAQTVSWRRMLQARAVQNAAAEVRREGEEELRITVRKRKPGFLVPPLNWVIRPRLERTIVLDRLGMEVWDLCDGTQTVEDVIDKFSLRQRLSFHEARVAVTGYIKTLVQRGALAIVEE